jgi:hypothetical protein
MPTVKALTKDHWNTIFAEISNILEDNKPKRKRSRSALSRGSEAPEEEEAAEEFIPVSNDVCKNYLLFVIPTTLYKLLDQYTRLM